MANGEKPYMTYSRYDGTGDVAQNVGVSGGKDYHEGCSSGKYLCEKNDPFGEIDSHEYGMMYEDEECCDNGHRDNILDKHHTHVSIGVVYDDYFFVIVQNFENQYITWKDEIDDDNPDATTVTMEGSFDRNRDGLSTNNIELDTINIFYDPVPTAETYQQNLDKMSYGGGQLVAAVVEPLLPGWYYEQPADHDLIVADEWNVYTRDFEVEFSLKELSDKYGDGVYTVALWGEDENKDSFIVAAISVFLY
jgi:hypothetical protein